MKSARLPIAKLPRKPMRPIEDILAEAHTTNQMRKAQTHEEWWAEHSAANRPRSPWHPREPKMKYASPEQMHAIKELMDQRRLALSRQQGSPTLAGKIAAKKEFNKLSAALQALMDETGN